MEIIRDFFNVLKTKDGTAILDYLKENKKFTEKLILGILIFICVLIYFINGKDEAVAISNEDSSSVITETSSAAVELQTGEIYVDVQGAVNNAGVVKLTENARVFQAIEAAGGLCTMADTSNLNLAQIMYDGDKLYVPFEGEITSDNAEIQMQSGSSNGKININSASSEELQSLNGIGVVTAGKIIDYRNQNGRFSSIEDLKNVSGIGDKTFDNIKDSICI